MEKIGVPTVTGVTGAVKSGGIGAVGGAIVALSQKFLGTGLIGALGSIAIAGSMLQGTAGDIITTILGYDIGKSLFAPKANAVKTTISEFIAV